MADDTFRHRVEWMLHLAVFLVNLPISITGLVLDSFHATRLGICYYSVFPSGCKTVGNEYYGKCERGLHSDNFLLQYLIPAISFLGIFLCAAILSRHAFVRTREFRAQGKSTIMESAAGKVPVVDAKPNHDDKQTSDLTHRSVEAGLALPSMTSSSRPQTQSEPQLKSPTGEARRSINLSNRQSHETKLQYLSRLYRREVLTQAMLFVLCFTIVHFGAVLTFIENIITSDRHASTYNNNDVAAMVFFSFLFPLGGLFNILVYCRPKVAALRRRELKDQKHDLGHDGHSAVSSISWIRGFAMVVAAGGEIPEEAHEPKKKENENQNPGASNSNQLSSGLSWYKTNESFVDEIFLSSRSEGNSNDRGEGAGWDGDGMEWFYGYRIEEETFRDIMYGRDFSTDSDMSGLSLEEEQ